MGVVPTSPRSYFVAVGVHVGTVLVMRYVIACEWYLVCVVGGLCACALNRSLADLFIVCSKCISLGRRVVPMLDSY